MALQYKGYRGKMEWEPEANSFYGTVETTRDIITFMGDTEEEAEQEFRNSLDVYLEWCEERGEEPAPPA